MKTKKKIHIIAIIALVSVTTSCTDNWNEHYTPQIEEAKTLWQQITERDELADFANLLQSRGYDKLLSGDGRYTVWAPEGGIDTTLIAGGYMTPEEVLTQVIENHIARSPISLSAVKEDSVKMLNGKQMKLIGNGNDITFNGTRIAEVNILCSNGLLHITNEQVRFNNNIWTYLRQDSELKSICDYLYGFNKLRFDPDASTLGGVVGGEKVYSDSVFVTTNELWGQMGDLNTENRTFTMIAPTNNAWNEAIGEFIGFYNYPEGIYRDMGDSIAKRRVVEYLVKRNKETDSITQNAVIVDSIPCSNGLLLKTTALNIDPFGAFVQDIVIEAEAETYMMNEPGNCDATRVFVVTGRNELSQNRYMRLTPTSALLKPTVTYAMPDVLSCCYDIGVVFAPMNLTKNGYSSTIEQKDGRVTIELRDDYLSETYKLGAFDIDGSRIDTVWVARDHTFDYCDYYPAREMPTESKLALKITGDVKRTETATLSRELYIDCIVLRPKKN